MLWLGGGGFYAGADRAGCAPGSHLSTRGVGTTRAAAGFTARFAGFPFRDCFDF
jgi:hypothetical protein